MATLALILFMATATQDPVGYQNASYLFIPPSGRFLSAEDREFSRAGTFSKLPV